MSRPCASAASVKRKASVPYFPITSSGSATLPLDFDIFCPSASRTIAWRYTSRKGTSCVKWMPSIAIRATQKNRMSGAVTSTEVG